MDKPLTLFYDNYGVMANSKEPKNHKRSKHTQCKYHVIWEIVQKGDVSVSKSASKNNLANPFTKTLLAKRFESPLEGLGLNDVSIYFNANGCLLGKMPYKYI